MSLQNLPKVIFTRLKNNSEKIEWIQSISQKLFNQRENFLILVPSLQAAHYIDELLWSYPPESFLPHTVTDLPSSAAVVIAIGQLSNPNNAAKILNLCPDPLLTFTNLLEIYEMYDLTTTEKAERSEKKLNDYRHHFFHITSLEIPNDLKSKYV